MPDFPLKRRDFLVGVGVSGLGLVFGLDLKPAVAADVGQMRSNRAKSSSATRRHLDHDFRRSLHGAPDLLDLGP